MVNQPIEYTLVAYPMNQSKNIIARCARYEIVNNTIYAYDRLDNLGGIINIDNVSHIRISPVYPKDLTYLEGEKVW